MIAPKKNPRHPRPVPIGVTEARNSFATIVNEVGFGKSRYVLVRRGKVLAAIVPASDLDVNEEAA